jgi:hypothetical protein
MAIGGIVTGAGIGIGDGTGAGIGTAGGMGAAGGASICSPGCGIISIGLTISSC